MQAGLRITLAVFWLDYFFVEPGGVVWVSLHSTNVQMSWNDVFLSTGLDPFTIKVNVMCITMHSNQDYSSDNGDLKTADFTSM